MSLKIAYVFPSFLTILTICFYLFTKNIILLIKFNKNKILQKIWTKKLKCTKTKILKLLKMYKNDVKIQ